MKLYIFKKHSRSHFERIAVELTSFQDHFITIQRDKESVELNWDNGYTFRDLHFGDVLLIYIVGDDFSRAHVLPIVRDLTIRNMDVETIVRSKLDQIKQENQKTTKIFTEVLKAISEFYLNWSLDDFNIVKEIIEASEVDNNMLDSLKNSIEKRRGVLTRESS